KGLLPELGACMGHCLLIAGAMDWVQGCTDGLAQRLRCPPESCRLQWLALPCFQGRKALQAGSNLFFVDLAREQQSQTLVVQATSRGHIALQGREPCQAEGVFDFIRLNPRLLANREALRGQRTS